MVNKLFIQLLLDLKLCTKNESLCSFQSLFFQIYIYKDLIYNLFCQQDNSSIFFLLYTYVIIAYMFQFGSNLKASYTDHMSSFKCMMFKRHVSKRFHAIDAYFERAQVNSPLVVRSHQTEPFKDMTEAIVASCP